MRQQKTSIGPVTLGGHHTRRGLTRVGRCGTTRIGRGTGVRRGFFVGSGACSSIDFVEAFTGDSSHFRFV